MLILQPPLAAASGILIQTRKRPAPAGHPKSHPSTSTTPAAATAAAAATATAATAHSMGLIPQRSAASIIHACWAPNRDEREGKEAKREANWSDQKQLNLVQQSKPVSFFIFFLLFRKGGSERIKGNGPHRFRSRR